MKSRLKYFFYNCLCVILPHQFYRLSVEALIWNEGKTKFLLLQEANGWWDIPGGGLDWGEAPEQGIVREVVEETGFEVLSVSQAPVCFTTAEHHRFNGWFANVVFEVKVKSTETIQKSDECVAIGWVTPEEAVAITPAFNSVHALGRALLK
ncbi:MAG: NUDIX hydrolase [Minisyncoccia bacterium]